MNNEIKEAFPDFDQYTQYLQNYITMAFKAGIQWERERNSDDWNKSIDMEIEIEKLQAENAKLRECISNAIKSGESMGGVISYLRQCLKEIEGREL